MDMVGCKAKMTVWAVVCAKVANLGTEAVNLAFFGLYNYSCEVEVYMAA